MPARQRIPRLAEFIVLFLLTPAALAWWASGTEIPVIPILIGIGALATLYMVLVAPAQFRAACVQPLRRRELLRIGFQLLLGTVTLAAYVLLAHPERLFDFPRNRTGTWVLIIAGYPLLSVVPQEVFFRAFFFQRYAPLWRGTTARVLVSAMVFGLAHLFYGHWLTVGLATVGGVFFSWTFVRTGSLLLVVLEHSAYGILLFTIGLGRLFHAGS